jgi:hypothetical protein
LIDTYNDTYSVHTEVLMSHWAHPPPVRASPWTSCRLHCCELTAYLTLRQAGWAFLLASHSWWPHFPRGLCTPSLQYEYWPTEFLNKNVCIIIFNKCYIAIILFQFLCNEVFWNHVLITEKNLIKNFIQCLKGL